MKLMRQGFFKEMSYSEEDDPSIFDFIQKDEEPEKTEICQYLEEGSVLVACGGIVQDVINPQNGVAGCPDMVTDGIWMWPGDLSYYVKKYNLKFDEKIIQTMRENNWHVKKLANMDIENIDVESIEII